MKKLLSSKKLVGFVFIAMFTAAIYAAIMLIIATTGSFMPEPKSRLRSDYILMLLQCGLGSVVILLPGFLQRKFGIAISPTMHITFAVFLFCAIYLGEVFDFYFRIPHWDTMLHVFSGFALGAIGFSIIGLVNKSDSVPVSLSPAFVAIFAFCFAIALGALWENF